jgi:hypothetical protein
MSRLWLYLGILLTCSGIGTALGVVLLATYFWSDIKKEIKNQQKPTGKEIDFNIDSMSDNLREKLR